MSRTYYAFADLQCGGLMHSGRNATSKAQALAEIKEYCASDLEPENEAEFNNFTLDDIDEIWQFELVSSKTKFKEF